MASNTLEIIIKAKDQTANAIGGITSQLQGIGKAALGVAATGVAVLGAGIATMAADGIRDAASMEAQISGIAAVMGLASDEIAPLKNLITDLGLNPNLKVTADEAAASIEMLARNGLSMDEILQGAAESTVLLANATGGEFSQSADIMTDSMALFGITAENTLDAVNGITSVVTNSKFSIEDYALALAQGGGVAATTGVEFADFNTAIAAMSPLFASGSDAGTSFKTMLQRLVPASGTAAGAMMELGLLSEDGLTNAFFDANGQMKDMADIAGILDSSLSGLTEEQRSQALSTIFGTDAMRAAVGLAEVGAAGFADLQEQMGQTDALAAAATRMDNLSGAFEIFQGVVDTAKLKLSDLFIPMLTDLVRGLTGVLDKFVPLIDQFFPAFIDTLQETGDPLAAFVVAFQNVVGPTSEAGQKIMEIATGIREFMARAQEVLAPIAAFIAENVKLQDVLIVLGGAIAAVIIPAIASIVVAAAPVIAAFVAAVAIVAALRQAWETDFGGIRDYVAAVWEAIQIAWEAFRSLFEGDWETFLALIFDAWQLAFSALVEFLGNLWAMVQPKLLGLWESIKAWFNSIDWGSLGKSIVDGIASGLSNAAGGLLASITGLANQAIAAFKGALGINSPSTVFAGFGANIGQGLVQGMQGQQRQVAMAGAGISSAAAAGATYNTPITIDARGATPASIPGIEAAVNRALKQAGLQASSRKRI